MKNVDLFSLPEEENLVRVVLITKPGFDRIKSRESIENLFEAVEGHFLRMIPIYGTCPRKNLPILERCSWVAEVRVEN